MSACSLLSVCAGDDAWVVKEWYSEGCDVAPLLKSVLSLWHASSELQESYTLCRMIVCSTESAVSSPRITCCTQHQRPRRQPSSEDFT
eukprot:6172210-Pleurochrysis_carterae.AAC.6